MGLATSRSDAPKEVILHKGCVLSDPYMTQGTCREAPTINLCGIYVNQLRNHNITNAQAKICKSCLPYGQDKKAQNIKSTTSNRGKVTSKIPIYE
jgi:hypothetical protein